MHTLTTAQLLAFRQCPRQLWLELRWSEQRPAGNATSAHAAADADIRGKAALIYAPPGNAMPIDARSQGWTAALMRTTHELWERPTQWPLLNAALYCEADCGRLLAKADFLLPCAQDGRNHKRWRLIQVHASTQVTDSQRDELALVAFVARRAGLALTSASIAVANRHWIYDGDGNYDDLLVETEWLNEVGRREQEVQAWARDAFAVTRLPTPPDAEIGNHCFQPHACTFLIWCEKNDRKPRVDQNIIPMEPLKLPAAPSSEAKFERVNTLDTVTRFSLCTQSN